MTGPPDFIGVGAHDVGSAWWNGLLARHPAIAGPLATGFFEEFHARAMTEADVARYHGFFPRDPGIVAGDWSPRCMARPWTPPLVARAAPDAKLLVIVSDPIERYRGRLGSHGGSPDSLSDTAARGRFASQLRRLWRFCERERTLVLQLERCHARPLVEYQRTLRFLGLDPVVPAAVVRRLRVERARAHALARLRRVPRRRRELWPDIEAALRAELEPEVRELAELEPGLELTRWPYFAHLAR
jgi:hypothetical protein